MTINYKLPENTTRNILEAMVAGAAIEFFFISGNPLSTGVSAALSGTATAIHAAITPLFQHYFQNTKYASIWGSPARTGIAVLTTMALASSLDYPIRIANLAFYAVIEASKFYLSGSKSFHQAEVIWLIK